MKERNKQRAGEGELRNRKIATNRESARKESNELRQQRQRTKN
jgi:hypothetical protein